MSAMRDALLKAGQITEDGDRVRLTPGGRVESEVIGEIAKLEAKAAARAIRQESAAKAAENMRRIDEAAAQRHGAGK